VLVEQAEPLAVLAELVVHLGTLVSTLLEAVEAEVATILLEWPHRLEQVLAGQEKTTQREILRAERHLFLLIDTEALVGMEGLPTVLL
jgi:hypothetical protein